MGCLTDKVLDEMRASAEQGSPGRGFCERSVQQIIWKARPPMAVLAPQEFDSTVPEPQYCRDCMCVAEMTYLMLGGQPLFPLSSSVDEIVALSARGVTSFVDEAHAGTSESAKAFVLELLRPSVGSRRRTPKVPPFREISVHMTHTWFRPKTEALDALDETYGDVVMHKLETWRNTLQLRATFVQLVADHLSLHMMARLERDLVDISEGSDQVSWALLQSRIAALTQMGDLLRSVNMAFGEDEQRVAINIREICKVIRSWRRRRVREVLWQVFTCAGAYDGVLPSSTCAEGLVSPVHRVWSRPCRVIDVVFPSRRRSSCSCEEPKSDFEEVPFASVRS